MEAYHGDDKRSYRHRNYMALYRPVLVLYGVLPGLYGDDIVLKNMGIM